MAQTAAPFIPEHRTLPILRDAVQHCRGCELYKFATQAVFGEGKKSMRIAMVGEQPGNDEDLQGHPFVGPAGRMLDLAIADAGLHRSEIYLTNAVKHFKFEERGKRRLHKKPRASEVNACKPWLEAEMALIKPTVIVCLGATAALSLLGSSFRLTRERGKFFTHPWAPHVTATFHPSAILRAPNEQQRRLEYRRLVADLKSIWDLLAAA